MAHDRSGTGPWAWIKVVGAQGEEMNADWRQNEQHLLSNVWFTRHPRSLRAGDVLVYYAAVWGRLVALMTLESDSDEARDNSSDPNDGRWRWSLPVRPVVTLPMKAGPTLTDVSIDPPRLRRKSHLLLSADESMRIRDLMWERASVVTSADASGTRELTGA